VAAWTAEAYIARSVAEVVANRAGAESAVVDDNYGDEGPGLSAGSTSDATSGTTSGTRVKEQQHAGFPLRPVRALREMGDFLYILQGLPCGRPPAAAVLGRQPV
jgi:hypothetical protein